MSYSLGTARAHALHSDLNPAHPRYKVALGSCLTWDQLRAVGHSLLGRQAPNNQYTHVVICNSLLSYTRVHVGGRYEAHEAA